MPTIPEVLDSINGAFPLFSYGERHIDEFLERFPFDSNGIAQRWEMFDRMSRNVMEFLRKRFPMLGERNCSICCDLQMYALGEKIERIQREYECYESLIRRASVLC